MKHCHIFKIKDIYVIEGEKETRKKAALLKKKIINKKKNIEEIKKDIKKFFENAILTEVSPVASLEDIFRFILKKPPYKVNLIFVVSEYEVININTKVYYN